MTHRPRFNMRSPVQAPLGHIVVWRQSSNVARGGVQHDRQTYWSLKGWSAKNSIFKA